jgi:hypothetical protein
VATNNPDLLGRRSLADLMIYRSVESNLTQVKFLFELAGDFIVDTAFRRQRQRGFTLDSH